MSNDIAIGTVTLPNAGNMAKKPPHLIELSDGKGKKLFVSLDRPEQIGNFIQVKGSYVNDNNLKDIEADVISFVSQLSKENICDMMLPTHRVLSIKNLAFKAK